MEMRLRYQRQTHTNSDWDNFAALTDDNDDDTAIGRPRTQMVHTQGLTLARCSVPDLVPGPRVPAASSGAADTEREEETEEKSLASQINRADVLTSSITCLADSDGGVQLQLLAGAGWESETSPSKSGARSLRK